MTPLARLLILSQFAFNIGFFAVLPYLAAHLAGTLGLSGAVVGLVLGLRTFSQQGLFVVGGMLTDRYGPRPVVLVGCALRVAGFCWLAEAAGAGTVIGAVVLVGFAAALFSPAVESEITREALRIEEAGGHRRTRTLARFSAGGQAGALLGPVVGTALLTWGGSEAFRLACLTGAGVFALVLAAHARLMPHTRTAAGGGGAGPAAAGRLVLGNRRFLRLAGAYAVYLLAYNQLYLALPAELDRSTGSQRALGWLFALSAALVVAGSGPLERLAATRLDHTGMARAGLLLIASSFATAALLRPAGGVWAALAFTLLLTVGQMLILPATRAMLPELVGHRHLGLFTGALSSLSGLAVLTASAPTGALLDHTGPLPWLLLGTLPLLALGLVPSTDERRGTIRRLPDGGGTGA
ncbi:MFS transporter [Streptomyces sp. NRRL F-5727]|uniref:MFS transporter n=1 Tax=Streptomyces sp. NRRL F-5727 TaxID=1463871 RepID=UPI000691A7DC|nr:MFS transporter [Streptomyces sp. NRRL F-5727]